MHKLYIIAGTDSLVTDNPRYLNSNPSSIIGFGTFPTPDVERNGRTLNWQEIEGAQRYEVYDNYIYQGSATGTQYDMALQPVGSHSFKVRAYAEIDGVDFYSAFSSPTIDFTVTNTDPVISFNAGNI